MRVRHDRHPRGSRPRRGRADSLYEFKLRFAPEGRAGAWIGKAVHDTAAYLARAGADAVDWDGFFPAYREPR